MRSVMGMSTEELTTLGLAAMLALALSAAPIERIARRIKSWWK